MQLETSFQIASGRISQLPDCQRVSKPESGPQHFLERHAAAPSPPGHGALGSGLSAGEQECPAGFPAAASVPDGFLIPHLKPRLPPPLEAGCRDRVPVFKNVQSRVCTSLAPSVQRKIRHLAQYFLGGQECVPQRYLWEPDPQGGHQGRGSLGVDFV